MNSWRKNWEARLEDNSDIDGQRDFREFDLDDQVQTTESHQKNERTFAKLSWQLLPARHKFLRSLQTLIPKTFLENLEAFCKVCGWHISRNKSNLDGIKDLEILGLEGAILEAFGILQRFWVKSAHTRTFWNQNRVRVSLQFHQKSYWFNIAARTPTTKRELRAVGSP